MEGLVQRLTEISITAGIVVLGVCLVRLLCKKAPKWIAVLLWGLVGLRLLLPFSVESPVSVVPSVEMPRQEQTTSPQGGMDTQYGTVTEPEDIGTVTVPGDTVDITPGTALPVGEKPAVSFWQIASVVWMIGATGMLVYAAVTYLGVWRRVRTATRETDGVYRSEAVGSPFILGVFHPRIYIPYSMEGEQLEAVLAHERAHVKRLDHIIKPLAFLLLSVYWFQPLLWLGYILLCRDLELACDERVVRSLSEEQRRDYSVALVTSAVGQRRVAACPLAFGEVAVKERVRSVMSYKKPAFWIVVAAIVLSVVAAVCLLTDPLSTTPYTTLDGATLKVETVAVVDLGDSTTLARRSDSVTLPKGEDYIMRRELPELGMVYFTLVEADDREMSATVTLSEDLYHNGRRVSKVNVSYWEPVTLNEKRDGSGKDVTLTISLPSTKLDNYWYSHSDSTSVTRYAGGSTVLYLYYKHFVLADDGMAATDLRGECSYDWVKENDYTIADSVKKYTQGSYEWVDGTLVLTEDGSLTRYVFRVNADGSLTHLKNRLSRHKKAQSPVLANGLLLTKEYKLDVVKNETGGSCSYTLRDGQERYSFTGESVIEPLEIISYEDGTVRLVREQPDRRYITEHEWIDLQSGESRGVCCYGSSDHRYGGSGYVPMLCEKDGNVILKAQYSSWCGTTPPNNFLFELEGLSDLRHGAVKAIVDNGEIVVAYKDDDGNARVIAEELTDIQNGISEPITRPLVTVTEYDEDGKTLTGSAQTVRYNQISAAYIRLGEEYADVDELLSNGRLDVTRLEEWLAQAVDSGAAWKDIDDRVSGVDAYQVEFREGDVYHTVYIAHHPDGSTDVTIGAKTYHLPFTVNRN